jgi:sugar lactone lactonase YvrE
MPARALDTSCLGCSIVAGYDVDSGKLLKKYEVSNKPAVHFLNDLVVHPSGDVFITDTVSGDVYRISREKDTLARWATVGEKTSPNGIDISADGRTLFVATRTGITRVQVADGAVTTVEGTAVDKPPVVDGLYVYANSLLAIQPFEAGRAVVRHHLDPGGARVVRTEVLLADHPQLKQPTTGVVVGDAFYFIANAQLQVFRAMYKDGAYDRTALTDVVVLRTRLTR